MVAKKEWQIAKGVRLPVDLARRIDRQAKANGTTASQIIRLAVMRYLKS